MPPSAPAQGHEVAVGASLHCDPLIREEIRPSNECWVREILLDVDVSHNVCAVALELVNHALGIRESCGVERGAGVAALVLRIQDQHVDVHATAVEARDNRLRLCLARDTVF